MAEVMTNFKTLTPRDRKYLQWIDSLPCLIPKCRGKATHHHVNERGHGAKGLTCSDYRTIPLCFQHHDEVHRVGRDTFAARYGIDYEMAIMKLNELWGKMCNE